MNGMKEKAKARLRKLLLTEDGLPRNSNDWTEQDWRDLHEAIEQAKGKIAARHRKAKK